MSKYTRNVKTMIIDPRYHDNSERTEFRLDNEMYFSDMRLVNIGAEADNDESYYNRIGGALSLIQNIYLYDGSQLLDQLRSAYQYLTFDTFNNSNSVQETQYKFLQMNGLGFTVNHLNKPQNAKIGGSAPYAEPTTGYPAANTRYDLLSTDKDTTTRSWLDLRRCFGILRDNSFLPGQMFKNLRIVIEWRSIGDKVTSDPTQATNLTHILRPALIADQLMSSKAITQIMNTYMKTGFDYYTYESDRVVVPAVANTSTFHGEFQLKGFNGKFVRRCLIINEPSNSSQINNIDDCSIAQHREKFRIHVNGDDVFPRDIDHPNIKVGMCTDTFGTCNGGLYSQYVGVTDTNRKELYENGGDDQDAYFINHGLLSYFGFTLNRVGNKFQIRYSRIGKNKPGAGTISDPGRQVFNMVVICEVKRRVEPSPNGYRLQYPTL